MTSNQLWLSVDEAAPFIGDKPDAIYRDIRENQFPFRFVKIGKRIKICARSLGLIPEQGAEDNEAQKTDPSVVATV